MLLPSNGAASNRFAQLILQLLSSSQADSVPSDGASSVESVRLSHATFT